MKRIRIDDESGDRKYFTIVPNFILNHSTAIDQSLYLHLKRYAGDKGSCYASGRTIRKKMGIGWKAFQKSIKYLLKHKWIFIKGTQLVETPSGYQKIKVYGIYDIWNRNNEFYQGVAKSEYLPLEVSPKGDLGVARSETKKNNYKEQEISPKSRKKIEELKSEISNLYGRKKIIK